MPGLNLVSGLKTIIPAAALLIATGMTVSAPVQAVEYPDEKGCGKLENPTAEQTGWCNAIVRRKGNCLACHTIVVNSWPETLPPGGNIAPPLLAMKSRFPERQRLVDQINDATQFNPNSFMPPFGKHGILSDAEIQSIVDFLLTI